MITSWSPNRSEAGHPIKGATCDNEVGGDGGGGGGHKLEVLMFPRSGKVV